MTISVRETDKRLIEGAERLRLVWMRDHMTEMLETAVDTKMTPSLNIESAILCRGRSERVTAP